MTAHESILAYVAAQLATIDGAETFRSRQAAVSRQEGTVIIVQPDNDAPEKRTGSPALLLRQFIILITVISRGDVPDTVADPVVEAIHAKLFADPTFSGLIAQLIERSRQWLFNQADLTACAQEIRYEARFYGRAEALKSIS